MHYAVLAVSLFLMSTPVHAQVAGQACDQFGATHLSEDRMSILGCLYTAAWPVDSVGTPPPTQWKSETISDNGADGGAYMFTNGNFFNVPSSISGTCEVANPFTGSCNCPAGFTPTITSAGPTGNGSHEIATCFHN
jgi:hypothetical protein